MVDRENIINGLQESAAYFRSSFDALYGTVACEKFRNWVDAIEQAIALLKAQEAEAETVAEAETAEPPMLDSDIGCCWYDITHKFTLEQVVSALIAQKPVMVKKGQTPTQ